MSDASDLLSAVENGSVETVKKLVFSQDIDKNTLYDSADNPIVYLAIKKIKQAQSPEEKRARIDVATILIEAGYAINVLNPRGHCALDQAVKRIQPKIVELLIARGATFQYSVRDTAGLSNNTSRSVTSLLQAVVCGQLEEVSCALTVNPMLAHSTANITDLSNRTFSGITALQYAVWALDYPMWTLIMRYLSKTEAAQQVHAFGKRNDLIYEHGLHYCFDALLTRYDFYTNNFLHWDYGTRCYQWQNGVGMEQAKMPAWLIYAFTEAGTDVAWTSLNPHKYYARVISEDFKRFHAIIRSGYAFTRAQHTHVFPETGWMGVDSREEMDHLSLGVSVLHDFRMLYFYKVLTEEAYFLLESSLENSLDQKGCDLAYRPRLH